MLRNGILKLCNLKHCSDSVRNTIADHVINGELWWAFPCRFLLISSILVRWMVYRNRVIFLTSLLLVYLFSISLFTLVFTYFLLVTNGLISDFNIFFLPSVLTFFTPHIRHFDIRHLLRFVRAL